MKQICNRAAITVIPQAPFIAWVQALDFEAAKIATEDIIDSPNAYLVYDSTDGDDEELLVKKNYKVIFEEELNGWTLDESLWPKKRDLKTFKAWFRLIVHSIVLDLNDKPFVIEED